MSSALHVGPMVAGVTTQFLEQVVAAFEARAKLSQEGGSNKQNMDAQDLLAKHVRALYQTGQGARDLRFIAFHDCQLGSGGFKFTVRQERLLARLATNFGTYANPDEILTELMVLGCQDAAESMRKAAEADRSSEDVAAVANRRLTAVQEELDQERAAHANVKRLLGEATSALRDEQERCDYYRSVFEGAQPPGKEAKPPARPVKPPRAKAGAQS